MFFIQNSKYFDVGLQQRKRDITIKNGASATTATAFGISRHISSGQKHNDGECSRCLLEAAHVQQPRLVVLVFHVAEAAGVILLRTAHRQRCTPDKNSADLCWCAIVWRRSTACVHGNSVRGGTIENVRARGAGPSTRQQDVCYTATVSSGRVSRRARHGEVALEQHAHHVFVESAAHLRQQRLVVDAHRIHRHQERSANGHCLVGLHLLKKRKHAVDKSLFLFRCRETDLCVVGSCRGSCQTLFVASLQQSSL